MVKAAEQRVAEHAAKKKAVERDWIARNYPRATGPEDGVLTEQLSPPRADAQSSGTLRVKYTGKELRYKGLVIGWDGPAIEATAFGSGANGVPGFEDPPQVFSFTMGQTKINPGLDSVIAGMRPGERKVAIVPAALGYGRAGTYPPEVHGRRRFVVSPNALLVYEVEVE